MEMKQKFCKNWLLKDNDRKQVSLIEGRFDRQKSIPSKLKCIELTIYQIFLRIFPDTVNFGVVQNTFLNLVFKEHGIAH